MSDRKHNVKPAVVSRQGTVGRYIVRAGIVDGLVVATATDGDTGCEVYRYDNSTRPINVDGAYTAVVSWATVQEAKQIGTKGVSWVRPSHAFSMHAFSIGSILSVCAQHFARPGVPAEVAKLGGRPLPRACVKCCELLGVEPQAVFEQLSGETHAVPADPGDVHRTMCETDA